MQDVVEHLNQLLQFLTLSGQGLMEFLNRPVSNFSILVPIVAGVFAWWRYRQQDVSFPKIEFLVSVRFKVDRETHWLAEVVCGIRNRGVMRFKVSQLGFRLRGLKRDMPAEDGGSEIRYQTNFPNLLKDGLWFDRPTKTFIEPGTTQVYRYVLTIPKSYDAVHVHGSAAYAHKLKGRQITHTADNLFRVPSDYSEIAPQDNVGKDIRLHLSDF